MGRILGIAGEQAIQAAERLIEKHPDLYNAAMLQGYDENGNMVEDEPEVTQPAPEVAAKIEEAKAIKEMEKEKKALETPLKGVLECSECDYIGKDQEDIANHLKKHQEVT